MSFPDLGALLLNNSSYCRKQRKKKITGKCWFCLLYQILLFLYLPLLATLFVHRSRFVSERFQPCNHSIPLFQHYNRELMFASSVLVQWCIYIPDICQPRQPRHGCKKIIVRGIFSYWTQKGPLCNFVHCVFSHTLHILCVILHTVCNFTHSV